MEHVVFYPSAEGAPAFRRVGSLDEAVNFVEHLRNIEGITDFSVYALTSVPLSFRAYYHVEVPADEAIGAVAPVAPAQAAPIDAAPVAAAADFAAAADRAPQEATPVDTVPAPIAVVPFVEAPAVRSPKPVPVETFVTAPAEAAPQEVAAEAAPQEVAAEAAPYEAVSEQAAPAADAAPVVDPSVEEVVPMPSGRRSMGFFARS